MSTLSIVRDAINVALFINRLIQDLSRYTTNKQLAIVSIITVSSYADNGESHDNDDLRRSSHKHCSASSTWNTRAYTSWTALLRLFCWLGTRSFALYKGRSTVRRGLMSVPRCTLLTYRRTMRCAISHARRMLLTGDDLARSRVPCDWNCGETMRGQYDPPWSWWAEKRTGWLHERHRHVEGDASAPR